VLYEETLHGRDGLFVCRDCQYKVNLNLPTRKKGKIKTLCNTHAFVEKEIVEGTGKMIQTVLICDNCGYIKKIIKSRLNLLTR
jgi:hypothetical protein